MGTGGNILILLKNIAKRRNNSYFSLRQSQGLILLLEMTDRVDEDSGGIYLMIFKLSFLNSCGF